MGFMVSKAFKRLPRAMQCSSEHQLARQLVVRLLDSNAILRAIHACQSQKF